MSSENLTLNRVKYTITSKTSVIGELINYPWEIDHAFSRDSTGLFLQNDIDDQNRKIFDDTSLYIVPKNQAFVTHASVLEDLRQDLSDLTGIRAGTAFERMPEGIVLGNMVFYEPVDAIGVKGLRSVIKGFRKAVEADQPVWHRTIIRLFPTIGLALWINKYESDLQAKKIEKDDYREMLRTFLPWQILSHLKKDPYSPPQIVELTARYPDLLDDLEDKLLRLKVQTH